MSNPAIDAYRVSHRFQAKLGGLGFWAAWILFLVDMTTPFPTPARGAFAMWWLLVIGLAAIVWVRTRRLPLEECVLLAEDEGGELTVPVTARRLGLGLGMAEKTLAALVEVGEAEEVDTGHARTWFFYNTNRGGGRLMRAVELVKERGSSIALTDLVEADVARDLDEAQNILEVIDSRGLTR